jgi:hypothetical protein
MNNKIKLFTTSLLQVSCVAINVVFIANGMWLFMLITGFIIFWLWCSNVKKIAIATFLDKLTYATRAMLGTGIGCLLSNYLKTHL